MAFLVMSSGIQSCIIKRNELTNRLGQNQEQIKFAGFDLQNLRALITGENDPGQRAQLAQRQEEHSRKMADLDQEGDLIKSLLAIENTQQQDLEKGWKQAMELCFKGIG